MYDDAMTPASSSLSDLQGADGKEERDAIVEMTRNFARAVVAPRSAELDAQPDPVKGFSWEIVEKLDEVGLRTATLLEEYGGAGVDSLTAAMIIEEIARADLGVAVIVAQTLKIAQTLQSGANADQRGRYLPDFANDPRFLLAIATTEPDKGSDHVIPLRDTKNQLRTTAVRRDGGWVLNGQKHFISNGNRAKLYLVFAQSERDKSLVEGQTCFLVPHDTPGFSIGQVHDKMGERLVNNAELFFDDCFVPDEDLFGEVGRGATIKARFLPASNAYAAASIIGVAEAAFDKAMTFCHERVQGGKRLIEHDTTRIDFSEMRMLLDVARTYAHKAARYADLPPEHRDPKLATYPKVFAARAAWQVVVRSLELHGGFGYMKEVGMDKLVRDAAAFLHSDGTERALFLRASRFAIPSGGPLAEPVAATDPAVAHHE
jgi:alkylation response protein AidB-like acyl-CoA dehydrogenase